MNKILRIAALSLGVFLLGTSTAVFAAEPAVARIPFPFTVGDKVLPAGEYRVSGVAGMADVIQIVSRDGRSETFAVVESTEADSSSPDNGTIFAFRTVGDQHYLVSVTVSGDETLTLAAPEHVPAR